ncbi:uncharacterized protein [Watersipora subatra]|uniref:uncharacterized protein n=1 Tax=Watersipora subatra TaxID=2589382 RepID=UPI00355B05D0
MAAWKDRRFSSISTIPVTEGDSDFVYKIITLGNAGVGKSTLMASYCKGTCQTDTSQQLSVDCKILRRGNGVIQISLWDTAGQERYDSITPNYYRGAQGCLLCFDITNEQSYADLIMWHQKLRSHCDPEPATILVGTKVDLRDSHNQHLQTSISTTDGRLAARNLGLPYKEVSCYHQDMIEDAFQSVIDMIEAGKKGHPTEDENNNNIRLPSTTPVVKSFCQNVC